MRFHDYDIYWGTKNPLSFHLFLSSICTKIFVKNCVNASPMIEYKEINRTGKNMQAEFLSYDVTIPPICRLGSPRSTHCSTVCISPLSVLENVLM